MHQINADPVYGDTHVRELISLCCAADRDPVVLKKTRDAEAWRGIIDVAVSHGIVGPLYLATADCDTVPPSVLDTLRGAYVAQAVRNFQLTTALTDVLSAFRASRVDVLVMKGPAVALLAYDQIAIREFTDLDLLIHPEDLSSAREALARLGFRQDSDCQPTRLGEKDVLFTRESDDLLVELHWAVTPRSLHFPLDLSGIWERKQCVKFRTTEIPTLGLEDTVLTLCIHGSKHGWSCLKWIHDVASLVARKQDEIDWNLLLERSMSAGCQRTLLASLLLAAEFFKVTPASAAVVDLMNSDPIRRLTHMASVPLLNNMEMTQREFVTFQIEGHDRWLDRFFVAVSLPVTELPRLLPKAAAPVTLGPLRFLTRPLRLFKIYGLSWFRSVVFGK